MRTTFFFMAGVLALGVTSSARADDAAAVCSDAFEQSQVRRDEGKLLEARRLFQVCGQPTCSPTRQKLCAQWLGDVAVRLPTFVLSAKDASGSDIVDVSVLMDGVEVARQLDGREIEVDPGPHSFVFRRADGTKAETRAIAVERGKGKLVSVTLGSAAPPPVTVPAPASPPPAPAAAFPPPAPGTETSGGSGSAWKTVGWVAGGAGVVGLGIGTVMGFVAISDNNAAQCNASKQCLTGPLSSARGAATAADVGLIAGGLLFAGGAALVLFGPSGGETPTPTAAITPVVGPGGGGVAVGGSW